MNFSPCISASRLPTRLLLTLALLASALGARSGTVVGPWVPLFKGVVTTVGTNTPGGPNPNLQVAYCVRVDLADPDVRLFASPRRTNWVANITETYGYTMTNFLSTYGLQVAVNANQFSPSSYFQAEGIACNASGMIFSQGQLVSPVVASGLDDAATLYFTSNNVATYYPTNVPAAPTNGLHTAVSGYYNILYNGVNVGSNYIGNSQSAHLLQPRTALGLSQDRRYLYLLVIDGRQGALEYSEGAYDWQTAEWLKLLGAWDGANMDGGGSTCLVVQDSTGFPLPLNRDSASLTAPGYRERTAGAHFGIYAAPLPGFFTNVNALPDDTAATITWTTTNAATTQLKYGTTPAMTLLTASNSALTTSHAVLLTNLTPKTGYYFAALGSSGGNVYVSPNYYFSTTNYLTSQLLFDLTNSWRYTTANLDGVSWKARTYDDTAWEGEGAGLLWTSINGANGNIPAPLTTEMPLNPGTDLPYTTYYFRTHFNFTDTPASATLQLHAFCDDGMVLYLNGVEIYRLRMPAAPTTIFNATLASSAPPCGSNAECPDVFAVAGQIVVTNLLNGDNVFAAEAHNYSASSSDVTFGLRATLTLPYTLRPVINVTKSNAVVRLKWDQGGYTLQNANAPTGTWSDVTGPVVSSPFTTNNPTGTRFYRLRK